MRKRNLLHPLAAGLATLFLVSAALPASASSATPSPQDRPEVEITRRSVWDHNQVPPPRRGNSPRGRDRWGRAFGAPEINPGLAAGGLALMIGGTLVLLGRRRPSRVRV